MCLAHHYTLFRIFFFSLSHFLVTCVLYRKCRGQIFYNEKSEKNAHTERERQNTKQWLNSILVAWLFHLSVWQVELCQVAFAWKWFWWRVSLNNPNKIWSIICGLLTFNHVENCCYPKHHHTFGIQSIDSNIISNYA